MNTNVKNIFQLMLKVIFYAYITYKIKQNKDNEINK